MTAPAIPHDAIPWVKMADWRDRSGHPYEKPGPGTDWRAHWAWFWTTAAMGVHGAMGCSTCTVDLRP